jgi:uncharacterized membrane protein
MKAIKESLQSWTNNLVSDKIATMIAGKIIGIHLQVSGSLNRWFNRFSTRGKKRLSLTIGVLWAVILITSAFSSLYTIPKLSQNYSSAHIGMPSELPGPKLNTHQLTDSLTIKK